MRIAAFIAGMILAMIAVGTVSVMTGAPLWATALRVIGTAFLAQLLYLGVIYLKARAGAPKQKTEDTAKLAFPHREKPEPR